MLRSVKRPLRTYLPDWIPSQRHGYSTSPGMHDTGLRRFLRGILPEDARRELFSTIDVFKLENPPSLARMPTTEADKEHFLYEVRNAYTHRSEWVGGVGDSQMWLPAGWPRDLVTTIFGTEITGGHWRQVWVYGWPWPLDRAVRRGLAAYVRMIVSGEI